jgi:hypothetical protein
MGRGFALIKLSELVLGASQIEYWRGFTQIDIFVSAEIDQDKLIMEGYFLKIRWG